MFISDLSHIEAVSENNQVKGGRRFFYSFGKNKATAFAGAKAFGFSTKTSTDTFASTTPFSSTSYSSSKAVSY